MEGLLCAKHFLRDPAGNKGAKLCIREVRVLWQQTGKHRAQPWGHRSSGISQNLQDGSEEAKRVQSGSQAEPTKSWGKSWEELTAIQDAWRWRAKEEPRKAKQRLVHSGVWLPKQSRSCGHTVLPGARTQGCPSAHRLFWGHPPPEASPWPAGLFFHVPCTCQDAGGQKGRASKAPWGGGGGERGGLGPPERSGATPHTEQQLIWARGCF